MSILVLQGSSRADGNTEQLTRLALEGLPHKQILLRELSILPIRDQRHERGGFDPVDDDYESVIREVLRHDKIIFATPVYWYTMTGVMKNFIDRWSQSLRSADYDFKASMAQKKAYVIAVGGDDPRMKAVPLIQQLKYCFEFVGMSFESYVIGKASRPGDILQDTRALSDAMLLNRELGS